MTDEYQIDSIDKPGDPVWEAIGGGIHHFNTQQVGESGEKRLCIVLYAPDREIVGGVIGETYWGWFSLSLMWVKEELRGKGHGSRLLERAEEEARLRGAKYVYLDTFSFQAPEFYSKHGYQVFGELQDFPPRHQRYFLSKQL